MAPPEQTSIDEELHEAGPSQASLGIDTCQTGTPAVPLLRRSGVRTLHKAILNRVWPLGRRQPRPPPSDSFWLDDDQVVTCASVLLYGALSEEASACVWVTHFTYLVTDLQLLGQGDESSEELQELRLWLRQTPRLVAYVVTQVWGAHWVCLAVDAPTPDRFVEVAVYDSKQEVRVDDVTDNVCTAARVVFEMKYPEHVFPGAVPRLIHVPLEDRQDPQHADCGFHVALFIAEDATRRRKLEVHCRVQKEAQLEPLHNCAWSAWTLRRWMQTHADFFCRPHSSSFAGALDREKCRAAFQELQQSAHHTSNTPAQPYVQCEADEAHDQPCNCPQLASRIMAIAGLVLLVVLIIFLAMRH